MNATKDVYISQFEDARALLLNVMHGITPIANNRPEGFPVTAAARMGNIAALADMGVIGMVAGETPLAMGEWKDKTGFSIPHPGLDGDVQNWMENVEFDVPVMHQYVLAVMGKIDEMMAAANDDMMAKSFVFGPMGEMPLGGFIAMATGLMYRTAGEISILRQINGLDDGYPK